MLSKYKYPPERIYAIFSHDVEDYFSIFPSRENFSWLYRLLVTWEGEELEKVVPKIIRHKRWPENHVRFMLQVFFELDFVKLRRGFHFCQ